MPRRRSKFEVERPARHSFSDGWFDVRSSVFLYVACLTLSADASTFEVERPACRSFSEGWFDVQSFFMSPICRYLLVPHAKATFEVRS
jgi:hypothetical protein